MASKKKIRVELPLSDAIPTEDDARTEVSGFRYPCEEVARKNSYKTKVLQYNVLAPVDTFEDDVRNQFREFIKKIESRRRLKEQARGNLAKKKESVAKIGRGLKKNGKN